MRLLIAMLEAEKAQAVEAWLQRSPMAWDVWMAADGEQALTLLSRERFDLLLLHGCLPQVDGYAVLKALWGQNKACPPRVLLLSEPELMSRHLLRADCVTTMMCRPKEIADLLFVLSTKPVPMLAAATKAQRLKTIEELLSALRLKESFKGRAYLSWLLDQIIPSPLLETEITRKLYPACAAAFGTTDMAVERCVRHAVEEVFTHGSIRGIEKTFGMTVDPERGKLTNRAFLISTAERVRMLIELQGHSRTRARSPKSMEMHQSPAAPTRV